MQRNTKRLTRKSPPRKNGSPNCNRRSSTPASFRQPSEPTYRLNRGDPMQRREEVRPGAIAAVGKPFAIDRETPEAQRRLATGPMDRRSEPIRSRPG